MVKARFIPAGAGNTKGEAVNLPLGTVHPRGCGEHGMIMGPTALLAGSSPRVRGTQTDIALITALLRFIPAGAGNTEKP